MSGKYQFENSSQLFCQVLSKYISSSQTIDAVSIDEYPEKLASSLSKFTYPILVEIFNRLKPVAKNQNEDNNELDFFYESRLLSLIGRVIHNMISNYLVIMS